MLNKIICGDCIEVLGKASEPFADLIFADPPFNIGFKYDKYYDKVKKDNYIAWTHEWMSLCKKVLKPAGSFYIAIGDDYAADVKIIADQLGLFMRNWIIWHYTFGQQTKNKFARSHTHIFYFVVDKKKFTFNDFAVRVPSDRQLIYNDKRANKVGKLPDDVWTQYSRVCGTFKERQGWHPCQMPESVLQRIIAASSNPGDCILDPFSGSGTTPVTALKMERNYVGIEISRQYANKSRQRLSKTEKILQNQNHDPQMLMMAELRRLINDTDLDKNLILQDRKILKWITNQLGVRMNHSQEVQQQQIVELLNKISTAETSIDT